MAESRDKLKNVLPPALWNVIKDKDHFMHTISWNVIKEHGVDEFIKILNTEVNKPSEPKMTGGEIAAMAIADTQRDWGLEDDEKQYYISERINHYADQATSNPEERKKLIAQAHQTGGNIKDAVSRAVWGRPPETKDPQLEEARRVGRELFRALHPELWNEIKNIGVQGMILAGRVYRDHGAAGIAELLGTRNRIIDDVLDEVEDDGEDLDDPYTQEGVIADVKRRIMEIEKDLFKRGFLRHSALSELAIEFK